MIRKKNSLFFVWLGYGPIEGGFEGWQGMHMDSTGSSKEMTLKKVYELALTAIAFLSFGIFVMQVIMCITAVSVHRI